MGARAEKPERSPAGEGTDFASDGESVLSKQASSKKTVSDGAIHAITVNFPWEVLKSILH